MVERAVFVASLVVAVAATNPNADMSMEYLLSLTSNPGGIPAGVDPAFDCAWRAYAATYAMQIQPHLSHSQQSALHDALLLSSLCSKPFEPAPPAAAGKTTSTESEPASRPAFFVDPLKGKDTNPGTITAPFMTLAAAVAASRKTKHHVADAPVINLRAGTHYLAKTVRLTSSDSGLTITAYNGEAAVVSGGTPLSGLKWATTPSGRGATAYVADVDASSVPAGIPSLQINGKRATLARYPNANAELDLFPAGYVTNKTTWVPPRWRGEDCTSRKECGESVDFNWPAPKEEWHGMYQVYTVGTGGACEAYAAPDNYSPWCSSSFYRERWGEMHYRHPSGFQPKSLLPHAPYKQPVGAVVHAWRPGHWYSWMFEVNGTTGDGNMTFGKGGNQGGEGNDAAGEWWIENVREELDAPNEYFYDESAGKLYYIPNATGAPPGEGFVVPTLANMIELAGDQKSPVANVSLLGLTITANRPTFMDPRGNPSGGDWALERMGAVLSEGAVGLVIDGCTFTRLDSNAIMLSGFNQHVVVNNNHFSWLGQNGLASWGKSNKNDGTDGNFPRWTVFTNNFATEVGVIQKQSSMYFQAETAEATIANNICFNIPRAAVNFNDGFGGGADMHDNLLFNTCRESSDHGAFNSWDRLPYLTTVRNGTASTLPAWNNVYQNFIVANYAADGGCLDNDDGSSWYNIHHNFCVYGGHKSDFDGNSKVSSHNIHVYPSVYGSTCVGELQGPVPEGFAEGYLNNICILPAKGDQYFGFNINGVHCDGSDHSIAVFAAGFLTGNNTVYVPGGAASVVCNHVKINASDWMSGAVGSGTEWKNKSHGYDNTSQVSGSMPSPATIITWAKGLLDK